MANIRKPRYLLGGSPDGVFDTETGEWRLLSGDARWHSKIARRRAEADLLPEPARSERHREIDELARSLGLKAGRPRSSPKADRELLAMHDGGGQSYAAIAGRKGLTYEQVRGAVKRARKAKAV